MSEFVASEEQYQKARGVEARKRLMGGVKREQSQRSKIIEIRRRMDAVTSKPTRKRRKLFTFPQPVEEYDTIPALAWRAIIDQVAEAHGLRLNELFGRNRRRAVVTARHEAWHRLRHETSMSLIEIGKKTGGFDHSTIFWGVKKHAERLRDGRAV